VLKFYTDVIIEQWNYEIFVFLVMFWDVTCISLSNFLGIENIKKDREYSALNCDEDKIRVARVYRACVAVTRKCKCTFKERRFHRPPLAARIRFKECNLFRVLAYAREHSQGSFAVWKISAHPVKIPCRIFRLNRLCNKHIQWLQ